MNTVIEESLAWQVIPRLKEANGAGNCRVSAEQGGYVMRILSRSGGREACSRDSRLAAPILKSRTAVRKHRRRCAPQRRSRPAQICAASGMGLIRGSRCGFDESEIEAALKSARLRTFRLRCEQAAENIRRFCECKSQRNGRATATEFRLGQIVRPLDSVGCYVPGGRYPLVSTLLMTVIPAQVAGVKNIRVVSPQPVRKFLAAAANAQDQRVLSHRRSASHCRSGLWNREHSSSRQNCWPGKSLCHGGQEAGRL